MQILFGKKHPARYESGNWNPAEQRCDATKRECRGVLKALKKFRHYSYGAHFVLEKKAYEKRQRIVMQCSRRKKFIKN